MRVNSTKHDSTQDQDLILLDQALNGKRGAWENFCKRFESLIIGCVRKILVRYGVSFCATDLADLVNDVWLSLLSNDCKKLKQYDKTRGYRLTSWIGLIAMNSTIDNLRARHANNHYLEEMTNTDQILVDSHSPQARLEKKEQSQLAKEAISHLNREDQQFVMACFHEERSPSALADQFGVSINTVYSRKFKIRNKLVKIAETMKPEDIVMAC